MDNFRPNPRRKLDSEGKLLRNRKRGRLEKERNTGNDFSVLDLKMFKVSTLCTTVAFSDVILTEKQRCVHKYTKCKQGKQEYKLWGFCVHLMQCKETKANSNAMNCSSTILTVQYKIYGDMQHSLHS